MDCKKTPTQRCKKSIIDLINRYRRFHPAYIISKAIHGHEKGTLTKLISGSIIIVLGVIISKSGATAPYLIHIGLDAIGYLIHGIGAVPFVETILKFAED
jgi:hypothetical protein